MAIHVSEGGYAGPRETKYLFVDGGCLRQMLDDAAGKYPGFVATHLDFSKLVQGYDKTFYYDSLPPRKNGEDEASHAARVAGQEVFFDSLRAIAGVHVYEGDARRRRKIVQQKKVDIMIAVDMLTHSFRRNMHRAVLLTADLDFKPLVDALIRDGMHVALWYPYGKPNKELVYAADERIPLTYCDLHRWSADTFKKSNPLPRAHSEPGKNIQGGFLRDRWPTTMRTTAELFEIQADGSFTIVFPSALNRDKDYYTYVSHPDLDLLKRYVHECFREFWKSSI